MNIHTKYLLLFLVFTGIFNISYGQNKYSRSYNSKFDITEGIRVNIQNKYGNVDIKDWGKKEIEFVITIIVNENNKEKVDQIFKNINVNINKTGNVINAITVFEEGLKKYFNTNSKENKVEINYSVYMPCNIPLSLSNRYGNAFINKLNAESKIDIGYGNLQVNSIMMGNKENSSYINLQYSSATLDHTDYLKIEMKYSKIQINKSVLIDINSKYSKCYIDNTMGLKCYSKYDEYKIGTVDHFSSVSEYTNMRFEKVTTNMIIQNKYGNYNIGYVPPSFKMIKIAHEYGSVNINIDKSASYQFVAEGKYGNIYYHENAKVNVFKERQSIRINGIVGNNQNTNSKVNITTRYGNIKLTE